MQFFRDLGLFPKLLSSFALVALLTTLVGWRGVEGMYGLNQDLDFIGEREFPALAQLKDANIQMLRGARELRAVLLDPRDKLDEHLKVSLEDLEAAQKALTEVDRLLAKDDKGLGSVVKELQAGLHELVNDYQGLAGMVRAGEHDKAVQQRLQSRVKEDAADQAFMAIEKRLASRIEETSRRTDDDYAFARNLLFAAVAAAVALALTLGYALASMLSSAMRRAVEAARQVAQGDLSGRIAVQSADEIGAMMGALRQMTEGLSEMVRGVRSGSESIATG